MCHPDNQAGKEEGRGGAGVTALSQGKVGQPLFPIMLAHALPHAYAHSLVGHDKPVVSVDMSLDGLIMASSDKVGGRSTAYCPIPLCEGKFNAGMEAARSCVCA